VTSRIFARRALYVIAWTAALWAGAAARTGGVSWMIGPIRVSSRQPLRIALVAIAAAGYYAWRFTRAEHDADASVFETWLRRVSIGIPVLAVLFATVVGFHYGSFAAGGSDSYGYVSQADLWLRGKLRIEQPWVDEMSWPNRGFTFSPLG